MNLNTEHRRMEDKSVTAFLLSPHYRTCRHLLLQIIVLLMTINVFWYEPLQSVSFWRRFGGFLAYFVSINTVIYMNLYILGKSSNITQLHLFPLDTPISSRFFELVTIMRLDSA